MEKVIEAIMAKFGYENRSEAFPYIIGMAEAHLTEEQIESMLETVRWL